VTTDAIERLASVVRESRLVLPGSSGVALLSGGPDSACLAAGLAAALGADAVAGLHLNYRLRDDSGEDEATCRALCERLGIELSVEHPRLGAGNVQEAAREARYAAAERLRSRLGAEWIATGHTRTDLAETMIYRLASSPGRRALLGLAPRRGRVVRPLLAIGRADARRLAGEGGLPFRDDPSNRDPRFARVRVREQVLPVLHEINPAAEENLAATWAELTEETEALEALVTEALDAAGAGAGVAVPADALAGLQPAIRRLALRALAERAVGREVALGAQRAAEVWRLAGRPEGGEVDLGGGLRAVCEAGMIRFAPAPEPPPEPVALRVPGSCLFGRWELSAELQPAPFRPRGPEIATLDAQTLGEEVEVRAWREGDRMTPLGLGGTKTLQDLFTDSRVPRSLRRMLPVIASGGRIAWVAGVAVSEEFKLGPETREAAVLTATLIDRPSS
jgi:tRNA(Ile)-lysidine synthase